MEKFKNIKNLSLTKTTPLRTYHYPDGPSGEEFNDDCPLQTTVMEATCAIVPGIDCAQGYPNDEQLGYD